MTSVCTMTEVVVTILVVPPHDKIVLITIICGPYISFSLLLGGHLRDVERGERERENVRGCLIEEGQAEVVWEGGEECDGDNLEKMSIIWFAVYLHFTHSFIST